METIESFKVNHLDHPTGIYLSKQDGDIFTYDVRISTPYIDKKLSPAELHSLEHLLATVLRNENCKNDVIYVGPMGCQTGFYILFRNIEFDRAKQIIVSAFEKVASFESKMPGKSKQECGYYHNLNVEKARSVAQKFLYRLNNCI